MKVRIGQQLHCLRCGKDWHARQLVIRMCPMCKTPYFDVPKKKRTVAA